MIFQNERRRLMSVMIAEGINPENLELGMQNAGVNVPNYLKERWKRRMTEKVPAFPFPAEPKLFNRYMLGADPEYAFVNIKNGQYWYAENFGLNTLGAFGCDMAGRQAELRAYPSRFAVEVVASMVEALRWMAIACPDTLKANWVGTPFIGRDGCAGHIHFGRKRPNRIQEIKALDKVTGLLYNAGIWNKEALDNRVKISGYGKFGDFRTQTHGYEYRTLPTWMPDPWLAYFVIVVAKLATFHKEPIPPKIGNGAQQLKNLIAAYRGMDDDAEIAYRGLQVLGFPKALEDDFKGRWGIGPFKDVKIDYSRHFFPSSIVPSNQTVVDVFNYIVNGIPIPKRKPEKTWDLFQLPKNIYKVNIQPHVGGLMDIAGDLISKDYQVMLGSSGNNALIINSTCNLDRKEINKAFRKNVPGHTGPIVYSEIKDANAQITINIPIKIYVNHVADVELCKQFKSVISNSKLFPICKGTEFSKVEFKESYKGDLSDKKFIGTEWRRVQGKRIEVPIERVKRARIYNEWVDEQF